MLDNQWVFIYYFNVDAIHVNIVAWLSLVERCVRDAEVASSNLVASIPACWSSGQDDALSRRKPGFDSRTGHEAVWNFHTASFFISIIVFINRKL